jgi:hypothetical protein
MTKTTAQSTQKATPIAANANANANTTNKKSAELDHRRQAVIAAAEAREKAHKAKTKPIKSVTKTTLARERQLQQQLANSNSATSTQDNEPRSEEARRAAEAAKQGEAQLAQQLGYNPYQIARTTAGQARTATTTAQHGSLSNNDKGDSLPVVAPPPPPRPAAEETQEFIPPPPLEFDEAFATLVSYSSSSSSSHNVDHPNSDNNNNNTVVPSTCGIIQKLVLNATTKGQTPNEDAAKFRKVRLENPKIKAALVDVPGAMEILLLAGFQLSETQEGESVLVFPADTLGPEWWPAAAEQLDSVK